MIGVDRKYLALLFGGMMKTYTCERINHISNHPKSQADMKRFNLVFIL